MVHIATRKTHNKIAGMVSNLPMKDIDEINRMVDDPAMLRKYGRYHRKYWGHNPSANAYDSRKINRGNAERERVRKVHIIVDTDPKIKRMVKAMELKKEISKMRRY